jgi:hypothetical protein
MLRKILIVAWALLSIAGGSSILYEQLYWDCRVSSVVGTDGTRLPVKMCFSPKWQRYKSQ